jgi:hypothetical protein
MVISRAAMVNPMRAVCRLAMGWNNTNRLPAWQLYTAFFSYGKSIGKNLKIGNEIENNYRIPKIVPVLVTER